MLISNMSMLVANCCRVGSFAIQGGDGVEGRPMLAFGSRPEGAKWLLERCPSWRLNGDLREPARARGP